MITYLPFFDARRKRRRQNLLVMGSLNFSARFYSSLGNGDGGLYDVNGSRLAEHIDRGRSLSIPGGDSCYCTGTFDMPTSYQWWVWERETNISWSMVTCQGSTRLELT